MSLALNLSGTDKLCEAFSGDSGTSAGTVTSSGSRRVGYVCGGTARFAAGGLTWTWGGVPMQLVDEDYYAGGNFYGCIFWIPDPPLGASSIAWAGGNTTVGGWVAFSAQDNDRATPFRTPSKTRNSTTVVPASAVADIVIGSVTMYGGSGFAAVAPTVLIDQQSPGGFTGGAIYRPGASPTATLEINNGTIMIGASLIEDTGGGPPPSSGGHDLPLLGVGKGMLPFWPAWWRYQRMQEKREKRIRQAERDCLRRHAA